MKLLTWFLGPTEPGVPRPLVVKPTLLTILERRRLLRAKRRETYREAWERYVEAQGRFLEAEGLDALHAAARDLSLAAAELRLLHEMPGE